MDARRVRISQRPERSHALRQRRFFVGRLSDFLRVCSSTPARRTGPSRHPRRITDLIASGQRFADIGLPAFDRTRDRVMLRGGPSVPADLKRPLLDRDYEECSVAIPGRLRAGGCVRGD